MFDRGLLGLSDDLDIMISRHVNDPSSVESIIHRTGPAPAPLRATQRPPPPFLPWPRATCFQHYCAHIGRNPLQLAQADPHHRPAAAPPARSAPHPAANQPAP